MIRIWWRERPVRYPFRDPFAIFLFVCCCSHNPFAFFSLQFGWLVWDDRENLSKALCANVTRRHFDSLFLLQFLGFLLPCQSSTVLPSIPGVIEPGHCGMDKHTLNLKSSFTQ